MRLNANTYPAYFKLLEGDYDNLKVDQYICEKQFNSHEKMFDFLSSLKYTFNQVAKAYYVTNTFKNSIITAMPKIIKDDTYIDKLQCHCGILFSDVGFTLYLSNPTDKKVKLLAYGFTRDTLTTFGAIRNDDTIVGIAANSKDGVAFNDTEILGMYLTTLSVALFFINNCEVEEKILFPNAKHRENGQKHYNESKKNLIILDCRWFTELIRSIPFHVKGHFRWQAHGEKHAKRKLIWIPEFEKKGYNRKAGVSSQK